MIIKSQQEWDRLPLNWWDRCVIDEPIRIFANSLITIPDLSCGIMINNYHSLFIEEGFCCLKQPLEHTVATGDTKVILFGGNLSLYLRAKCTCYAGYVKAYDNSQLTSFGTSRADCYNQSVVRAWDESIVSAMDSSTINAGDYYNDKVTVRNFGGNTTLVCKKNTKVVQCGS